MEMQAIRKLSTQSIHLIGDLKVPTITTNQQIAHREYELELKPYLVTWLKTMLEDELEVLRMEPNASTLQT